MSQDVVVVGVDGSSVSQVALQWAVHVARCYGAAVTAVRAWESGAVSELTGRRDADEMPERVLDAVEVQVQQALEHQPSGAVPVGAHALEGDPAKVLLSAAVAGRLLVLGRQGEGSLRRRLLGTQLGSVVSRCLTHAAVPVAVVPPDAAATASGRVLVGVDGSMESAGALRWGVQHARSVGAPVVAVMSWQLTTVPPPESAGESWAVPPLEEWEAQARSVLDRTVDAALGEQQVQGVDRQVLYRPAAAGLLDAADPEDLLVLGHRGRGGFSQLLLGSVSRQCAEHARCPVVVVPSRAPH